MPIPDDREMPVSGSWLISIMEEASIDRPVVNSQSPPPMIQRVPSKLSRVDCNKKCYVPSVVSIGPYHHGKEELAAVEKLKPQIAADFVRGCGMAKSDLFETFMDVACRARNCYADDSTDTFDDEAFAKMMFVDGCFILRFADCSVDKDKRANIELKRADFAYAQRDLFLLENQIPFSVLETLISIAKADEKDEWMKTINDFVLQTRAIPPEEKGFCILFSFSMPNIFGKRRRAPTDLKSGGKTTIKDNNNPIIHLLDLFHKQLIDKKALPSPCKKTTTSDWHAYRSVTELKTTGVKFHVSETSRFTDVKYKANFVSGNLSLPPMTIDDSTKSILLNLVAYEMCPDTADISVVTSYICLMDSLIDRAEDVRELRSKGILLNFLGSDQHVAELFNEIGDDLVPNPLLYDDVKEKIGKHYKDRCMIWITEWLHTHFRTPWAFLAFLAAVSVIALTAAQVYFAANPPSEG